MAINAQINTLQASGDYEVIYPQTVVGNIIDIQNNYYNKEQILTSGVCDLLEIPQDSEPKDAFTKLSLGVGKYAYEINLKDSGGHALSGLLVSGINAIDGGNCYTDENGYVLGVSEQTSVTITITSPYFDLESVNQTLNSTGIISTFNLIMNEKYTDGQIIDFIDSQANIKFSSMINTVDFCAIGGGGDGAKGVFPAGGAGGGGGYVANSLGELIKDNSYKITIGSKSEGNGGKVTIFKNDNQLISAKGGDVGVVSGGVGNGNGGKSGSDGVLLKPTAGSGYIFNDSSLGSVGGGGGYGYFYYKNQWGDSSTGAQPHGGNGGNYKTRGGNATGYGGGGGGGGVSNSSYEQSSGGTGYPALAKIRLHFNSTI